MANPPPLATSLPPPPTIPAVDPSGVLNPSWYTLLFALWARTGGSIANISPLLDTLSQLPGSLVFRGISAWTALAAGTRFQVLREGESFPEWDFLDGNSFGAQQANEFFISQEAGVGVPTFRKGVTADFVSVAGQFPGIATNAAPATGNVGEYIFSEIVSGAALAFVSGTARDITSIDLSAGDWDAWATLSTAPATGATQTSISAWINTVSATDPNPPNFGAYSQVQTALTASAGQSLPVGQIRLLLAAPTTVYLSATAVFGGAVSGYGFLGARRRR